MSWLLFAACLLMSILESSPAYSQSTQNEKTKTISILNSFTSKGLNEGAAALGDDGFIWNGTITSVLRRFDPAIPGKIVSEEPLTGGAFRAVKSFKPAGHSSLMVIGTGTGVDCFDTSGKRVFSYADSDAALEVPPIEIGSKLIFVDNGGRICSLTVEPIDFKQITKSTRGYRFGFLGSFTSASPTFIFSVATVTDAISGQESVEICFADLSGAASSQPIESDAHGIHLGNVVLQPTIVSETAFLATDRGNVLTASRTKVNTTPLLKSDLEICAPIIHKGLDQLSILGTNQALKSFDVISFSTTGKITSRRTITDSDENAITARTTSLPVIFKDKNNTHYALIAFSDSYVRLINIDSGQVVAKLKNPTSNKIANITQLDTRRFWLSEESGPEPDELTNQYLVQIE